MTNSLHVSVVVLMASTLAAAQSPTPKTHAHYRVLSAEPGAAPPFHAVEVTYGPTQEEGGVRFTSWQLEVRPESPPDAKLLFVLRAVTDRDPLAASPGPLTFLRYQLAIPETGEVLEYRNIHGDKPLLPPWGDFAQYFVPRPATGTRRQLGVPNTCEYLGHVLTLQHVAGDAGWAEWEKVKVLRLDPELLIGTGRNVKDKEGHRLPQKPQRQDYHYVPFTADDYRIMIEAGVNRFIVAPDQEPFVRAEPVFYLRGPAGDPPLRYPADLYRSNYVGHELFMDEPTCIMVGDKRVNTTLKYFTDAAALLTKRVRSRYRTATHGAYQLEAGLKARGISFGDMRLAQLDFPSWETIYETAYYQLAGGLTGIVHEGRYQLDEFNTLVTASTGLERKHTAPEMFRYHYAFLRGAARHFGKDWGMSIYGQADPALSPIGMALAYDMGARYIWYWTSDHDHHLPWPEQLDLTRALRRHTAQRPRSSIRGARPTLDKVILIPYGYFLTLESSTGRKQPMDLWWVREMDPEGKNESSQRYRRLMRNAFTEVDKAFDAGEDFDISVDDGREITGYRRIVRVSDD